MLPWLIFSGLGMGITWTAQWIVVATGIPDDEQGIATGIASTTQQIGSAIGLAALIAVTALATRGEETGPELLNGGIRSAFFAAAGMLALGVLIARTILARRSTTAEPINTAQPVQPQG